MAGNLPTNGYRHLVAISDKDGNVAALVFDGTVFRLAVDAIIGGPIIVGSASINGVEQDQAIETVAPLGAGATFTGAARDCDDFESFGISVFVTAGVGALNATVTVENSSDGGVTFRSVESVNLVGAAGASETFNRVYSVTRTHYRVKITNNDGVNALTATELISMRKPI